MQARTFHYRDPLPGTQEKEIRKRTTQKTREEHHVGEGGGAGKGMRPSSFSREVREEKILGRGGGTDALGQKRKKPCRQRARFMRRAVYSLKALEGKLMAVQKTEIGRMALT